MTILYYSTSPCYAKKASQYVFPTTNILAVVHYVLLTRVVHLCHYHEYRKIRYQFTLNW